MLELRADATRGGLPESVHRISVAVVDPAGQLVARSGDPGLRTFWRSAAKPFQALPVVADGAADRFGLTDVLEISLQASAALFDTPFPSSPPARALPGWLDLFPVTPDPLDIWQGAIYPARRFARPSERLGYLARVLLMPTLAERRLIRLPRRLRALYYPLRPLRLGGRWGLDVVRRIGQRFPGRLTSSRDRADHFGSLRRLVRRGGGPTRSKQESA